MNIEKVMGKLAQLTEIQQDRSILLGELRRSKVEAFEFRSHILKQITGMTQEIKKISEDLLSEGGLA